MPASPHGRGAGVVLERLVDLAHAGDLAGLHGEVVAHEAVEVRAVGLLPEVQLHRPPVLLVEPRLQLGLQPHQDEVADQVGLAQLLAGRVHALEDELRVVLVAAERDVHHHQLGEAAGRPARGRPCCSASSSVNSSKFCVTRSDGSCGCSVLLDDGLERGVVGLREQQLEVALAALRAGCAGSSGAACAARSHRPARASPSARGQRLDQQRHRGQALLAVDHEQRRLVRDLRQPLLDVDDGADEVDGDGVVATRRAGCRPTAGGTPCSVHE